MKNLILIIGLLLTTTVSAQWETKTFVDDFGDPTTDKYEQLIAVGTFSNSATLNSSAKYRFIKTETSIIIDVYEYTTNLATDIEATIETVKIKTPSGKVVVIENAIFVKTGSLAFINEAFTELTDTLTEKGTYAMVFNRTSDYSTSNYKLKFEL